MKIHISRPIRLMVMFSLVLLSLTSQTGWAEIPDDVDIDDNGLIEISTLADADEMRNDLAGTSLYGSSAGCPAGGCFGYELTNDIDFDTDGSGGFDIFDEFWNDGKGWLPIGDSGNPFTATFNGNGFVIRNLIINRPIDYSLKIGFFSVLDGATVTGVGFNGSLTYLHGFIGVGILAGEAVGSSVITDCFSEGKLIGGQQSGGLIGLLSGSTLTDSYTLVALSSIGGSLEIGGLVGRAEASADIRRSFARGSVTTDFYVAGGLVGGLQVSSLTDVYADVDVTCLDNCGGLAGYATSSTIMNAYAAGDVNGGSYTGGLLSDVVTTTVTASYWDVDATGQSASAGSLGDGLTTGEMQCPTTPDDIACTSGSVVMYSGWGASIWDFGDASQYPALIIRDVVHRDSDGDSVFDEADAFPYDPAYWNEGSVCGADNGRSFSRKPVNLCAKGLPSIVEEKGPWTWTCSGVPGGPDAGCSARYSFPWHRIIPIIVKNMDNNKHL